MSDLLGSVFGRLTVVAFEGKDRKSNRVWSCICECGERTSSLECNLTGGKSTTCGCVTGIKPSVPIAAEQLRELFHYDQESGIFTRKRAARGSPIGTIVGDHNRYTGYISIQISGKRYAAHRLAHLYMTGSWPVNEIDHKHRRRSDNRWSELRPSTSSQNRANTGLRRDNTSGFRGVSMAGRRWIAYGSIHGKTKNLGSFGTPEEASLVYERWAIENFGEFHVGSAA